MIDIVLDTFFGDSGKGKVVDMLAPQYDAIARFHGGSNAGHSIEFQGVKYVLNVIPSGIFHDCINIIGSGVVLDAVLFKNEVNRIQSDTVDTYKTLHISEKAHLVLPTHKLIDAASEKSKGDKKIGSTLRGISPTYQDKIGRCGLRVGDILSSDFLQRYTDAVAVHVSILDNFGYYDYDLYELNKQFFEAIEFLKGFKIVNTEYMVNDLLDQGKNILAEGAQGTLLDIDYGTYPFVTSSNTIAGSVCTGLGVAPQRIRKVFGVFKAYSTRVGSGPFPTEQDNEAGENLRKLGNEFGATTGRPRRTGWLDLPTLKYAVMVNGVTDLICTKGDVLSGLGIIPICDAYKIDGVQTDRIPYRLTEAIEPLYTALPGWDENISVIKIYDELPQNFKKYMEFIEKTVGMKVNIISVGPDREQTIFRD